MSEANNSLQAIQHIRQMMEKSSRFISLSGWSGIAAGACALAGAAWAYTILPGYTTARSTYSDIEETNPEGSILMDNLSMQLLMIAGLTFVAALVSAFIFTYIRSKKKGLPLWNSTTRRLTINVCIPMLVGGIFLLQLLEMGVYGLIAPGCLLFYGLALVNGSKYTVGEIRYLGYGQIILGIMNCWFIGYGLVFWALGFGILHIVYGAMMWWKYDRVNA